MKYITIVLALVLVCCKPAQEPIQEETKTPTLEKATVASYENLNAQDFQAAISSEDVIVLDVRTPEEIEQGAIPGAISMNFYDEDFADQIMNLDPAKEIYVYCKGGGRSAKTCRLMLEKGFGNLHNLDGGYVEWEKEFGK